MEWDDELCLCFHVSPRKVWNYLRLHKPQRASQLSECQGAGTGCGWCRRYLASMFDRWAGDRSDQLVSELPPDTLRQLKLPGSTQYAADRASYVLSGGGVPAPGATPLPTAGGAEKSVGGVERPAGGMSDEAASDAGEGGRGQW